MMQDDESIDEMIARIVVNGKPLGLLPPPSERKRLRMAFGITQAKLAGELGVSRQMIVAYERGSEPTGETRDKYRKILNALSQRETKTRE